MHRYAPALALIVAAGAQGAVADDSSTAVLMRSVRAWEAQQRPDLARVALEKLLLSEPGNTAAALRLGMLELRSGRMERVRELLAQMQAFKPNDPATLELADSYRIATQDRLKMATVQRLSEVGKYAEALAALQALFPRGPPIGELAISYFQLLGAMPQRWPEARAGMTRLAAEHGDEPVYELALAKLLSHHTETRAEALRRLARLAARRDVDQKEVQQAWSSVLVRMPDGADTLAAMNAYLRVVPDDVSLRQLHAQQQVLERERLRRANDPALKQLARGQAALDNNDLATAQSLLEAAYAQRPRESDAAGALGLLRLRQSRHTEAEQLFETAARLPKSQVSKWRSLVRTTRYWGALKQAQALRATGQLEQAERTVRTALKADPRQPDGLVLLAVIRSDRNDTSEAGRLYAQVLARDPGNDSAQRGLLDLLQTRPRPPVGLALAGQLEQQKPPAAQRAAAVGTDGLHTLQLASRLASRPNAESAARYGLIRAAMLQDEADAAASQGRDGAALRLLEQAQELAPDNPWIRFDLGGLYRRLGLAGMARELMAEGVERAPQDRQMQYANALLLASLDDDAAAQAALDGIPELERSEGMRALERRLQIARLRAEADAAVARGDLSAAQRLLEQAATTFNDDANLQASLAFVRIARGERTRALQGMSDWVAAQPAPTAEMQLALARVYERADAETPLASLIERLRAGSELSTTQSRELARLDAGSVRRRAVTLRERRDYSDALELLGEARLRLPDDRRLLQEQARVLFESGDARAANALYQQALRQPTPDATLHLDYAQLLTQVAQQQLLGGSERAAARAQLAASAALAGLEQRELRFEIARSYAELGDRRIARGQAQQLLEANPDDAGTLLAAARVARAAEYDGQAASWLEQARAGGSAEAVAELARMDRRWDDFIATAVKYSDKPGDPGISSYTASTLPLELRLPLRHRAELFAHVDQVRVDAGTLPAVFEDGALYGQVQAFGPAALAAFAGGAAQQGSGTDFGIGVEDKHWRLDLGTTPIGFLVQDLVGGARYSNRLGPLDWSANLQRRPVTSSLLAYSGARDPVSGEVWGGVRSNGLELRASLRQGPWSSAASAGYFLYRGRNVLDNSQLALRANTGRLLLDEPDMRLELGVSLSYSAYAENQRYYSFGHGGYYSPQSYLSLGVPFEWTGRSGYWAWRLRGSLAYSRSEEDEAAFYPTRPALQAAARSQPLPRGFSSPVYRSGSGAGLGKSLSGSLEYELWPRMFGGGAFEIDRSAYYAPNLFTLYLRYELRPMDGRLKFPPRPAKAYSEY